VVHARRVAHAPGAIGVRVHADDAILAFSGDSGPCDALVELCREASVALLECSYRSSRATEHHLSPRTVGEIARAAGIRRLVLTHFYPELDDVDVTAEVR
jgi:ribonuclease BN (tRNA processing enzyme)